LTIGIANIWTMDKNLYHTKVLNEQKKSKDINKNEASKPLKTSAPED